MCLSFVRRSEMRIFPFNLRFLPGLALILTLVLLALPVSAKAQTANFSYSNSPVTLGSNLYRPIGVAVDASGNLYVADSGNNAVKEFLAATSYTTFNTLGGGFLGPQGVAVDTNGNVYVADTGHNAVDVLTPGCGSTSCITLLANVTSPAGVAVAGGVEDGEADCLLFVPCTDVFFTGADSVWEVQFDNAPFADQLATSYTFNGPTGIAVDGSENVFVADSGNNAVQEILAASGSYYGYSTVIAVGSGFNDPIGVAVDPFGNVFVGDDGNNAVKEILAAGGYTTVNTVDGSFSYPHGVAVDGKGNVFVAGTDNTGIVELATAPVDFGTVAIGQTSAMIPLTFTFDSGGTIGSPVALTQGAAGLDFAVANGGTCAAGGNLQRRRYLHGQCDLHAQVCGPSQWGRASAEWLRNHHRHGLRLRRRFGAAGQLPARQPEHVGRWLWLRRARWCCGGRGRERLRRRLRQRRWWRRFRSAARSPLASSDVGRRLQFPQDVAVDGAAMSSSPTSGNNAVKEIAARLRWLQLVTRWAAASASPLALRSTAAAMSSSPIRQQCGEGDSVRLRGSSSCVRTLGSGFSKPAGVAVDGSGNVFVADSGNNAVKEILAVMEFPLHRRSTRWAAASTSPLALRWTGAATSSSPIPTTMR